MPDGSDFFASVRDVLCSKFTTACNIVGVTTNEVKHGVEVAKNGTPTEKANYAADKLPDGSDLGDARDVLRGRASRLEALENEAMGISPPGAKGP